MSEGIFALLGLIVGSVGTFFNTWYKHNKEEEKEEKELKREKLELIHKYINEVVEEEKMIFNQVHSISFDKEISEEIKNPPRSTSYESLKLLIDLYHQDLKEDYKKIISIKEDLTGSKDNYIRSMINMQVFQGKSEYEVDPFEFISDHGNRIKKLKSVVLEMQEKISKIANRL